MKCFYHDDLDGRCAAYWVYKKYGDKVDFHSVLYDGYFPFTKIGSDEKVFLVDYSFDDLENMERLLKQTERVYWFDHHASTLRKYAGTKYNKLSGKRVDGEPAACELVKYFMFPGKDEDLMTRYIALWDTWTWESEEVLYFRNGMLARSPDPTSPDWEKTVGMPEKVIEDGEIITKFRERRRADYVEDYGFEVNLDGLHCYACNMGNASSRLFDSIEGDYDALIAYVYNGRDWKISMYSEKDDIDLAEVATDHGGGGHPGAAGFLADELPFEEVGIR